MRLERLASSILFFPTIGSTNDVASECAQGDSAAGERGHLEGLVVIADTQTSGRGRHGRVWVSPRGSGLYVSVLLTPAAGRVEPLRATMLLTLAAGVGLVEGIEAATGLRADLKWPNDLVVGRRKLAGILAEATAGLNAVIVGFGINVNAAAFPHELADQATSIESELGRAVDRWAVLAATLASLDARYDDLLDGRFDAILDAWRRRAPASIGAKVTWQTSDGPMTGVTAGIDDHGALRVRVGDRVERIVSGEIGWDIRI